MKSFLNKTAYTKDLEHNRVVVEREFQAGIDRVWRAWTESEQLDQWWGPKPYKAETKSMDFRVGGAWLYSMVGPEGERHWGREDFLSISKPLLSADYCSGSFTGLNAPPSFLSILSAR